MLKLELQYFGHLMWRTDSLGKTLMLGKIEDGRRRGMTEDEMVGWHHQLDGHESEQVPRVGDGPGSLVCCSPWGHKESDMTEGLNWTDWKDRKTWCWHFNLFLAKFYTLVKLSRKWIFQVCDMHYKKLYLTLETSYKTSLKCKMGIFSKWDLCWLVSMLIKRWVIYLINYCVKYLYWNWRIQLNGNKEGRGKIRALNLVIQPRQLASS